jgi:hypothetical protein
LEPDFFFPGFICSINSAPFSTSDFAACTTFDPSSPIVDDSEPAVEAVAVRRFRAAAALLEPTDFRTVPPRPVAFDFDAVAEPPLARARPVDPAARFVAMSSPVNDRVYLAPVS